MFFFVEEDLFVNEVMIIIFFVFIDIVGEVFYILIIVEIYEEVILDVEYVWELEEIYDEVSYDYVFMDIVDWNDYVIGEFISLELLEVIVDDEFLEFDFGE